MRTVNAARWYFGAAVIGCGSSAESRLADAGVASAREAAAVQEAALADSSDSMDVHGSVVDLVTSRPLAGRAVVISGARTTTDDNGLFQLTSVPAVYDVTVVDPDGSTVSIYQGLTIRNPVLPHAGVETPSAMASLVGSVAGGTNYPLGASDSVGISFFSPQANLTVALSGALPVGMAGPDFGPLQISWGGTDVISGEVVALGAFSEADGGVTEDAAGANWFALQQITMSAGQNATLTLTLAPVVQSGRIAGAILAPTGASVVEKQIFYRFPFPGASIAIPTTSKSMTAFDDNVPDLSGWNAQLCVGAAATPGSFLTQECGISLGTVNLDVALQAPPLLSGPTDGSTVTTNTAFSWTGFDNGIEVLMLLPLAPSATVPRIYVFTNETSARWPDLSAIGVAYAKQTTYQCQVEGLGPYESIDEAMGPDGVGTPYPASLRRSVSPAITITTGP
jgi:hypothetical protein